MTEDLPIPSGLQNVHGINAADIYHREFKRVMVGGYDMHEVDEFLTRVADAFDALQKRLQAVEEREHELREQAGAYQEMEETLRNALVTSQKFSENIIDVAKREADSLVEEARVIKARAQFEASKLPTEVARDIRRLQEQRARLRSEIQAVLRSHQNLLESLLPAEQRLAEESSQAARREPARKPPSGDAATAAATEEDKS